MFRPSIRRRVLLSILVTVSFCLVGAKKYFAARASTEKQSPAKACQSKPKAERVSLRSQKHGRFHLGTTLLDAGYTSFSGPAFLPLYYSYIDPFWRSYLCCTPYYAYPPSVYAVSPGYGQGHVKLQVKPRTAEVLINNSYAGTVASLKGNIWLKAGVYDLTIKAPDHCNFHRRIYVLSGKKLDIVAKLAPETPQDAEKEKP